MLSTYDNRALTEVGADKPAGKWLRRYWHPIAISDQWDGLKTLWVADPAVEFKGTRGTVTSWGKALGTFEGKPTAIRILGEDLLLFRDRSGRLGLVGLYCSHRGASLAHGRIQQNGISCCYHGWCFDAEGSCISQPAEPHDSKLKERANIPAYPVQEMGGLIWAYMGKDEPPILPRLEVLAREDGVRAVENFGLWPANYLQICENSVDQAHTGILHAGAEGERSDIWGTEIPETHWERTEFGIKSTQIRHSINNVRTSYYFNPTVNLLAQPWPGGKYKWPRFSAIWRTPVDDFNTLIFSVVFTPYVDGKAPDLPKGLTFDITEQLHLHRIQDYEATVSQGPIYHRSPELLGRSDRGVVMLRRMVAAGIQAVENGEEPQCVWRDPAMNKIITHADITTDTLMMPATATV